MIAIYCILNTVNGKRYIGKTKNTSQRWIGHKCAMRSSKRHKDCNVHLWNSAQKHGVDAFMFIVLESFEEFDDSVLKERELFWMDFFKSTDREYGYNLRRDSSSSMIVHQETRDKMRESVMGEKNPNFGNNWSDRQKQDMSKIAKDRHASGKYYGEEWRKKQSITSSNTWKNEELKAQMTKNVSLAKQKYDFLQYDKEGNFIRSWESVEQIVKENPEYKWQNIYSVCNGYKPTYRGFVWKKVLKDVGGI